MRTENMGRGHWAALPSDDTTYGSLSPTPCHMVRESQHGPLLRKRVINWRVAMQLKIAAEDHPGREVCEASQLGLDPLSSRIPRLGVSLTAESGTRTRRAASSLHRSRGDVPGEELTQDNKKSHRAD